MTAENLRYGNRPLIFCRYGGTHSTDHSRDLLIIIISPHPPHRRSISPILIYHVPGPPYTLRTLLV